MTLVILAAGLGSRFGGIKQLTDLTGKGEFIIDFTIYDAVKVGFDKIVFIIREEHREIFDETIGSRARKMGAKVEYVYQTFELPAPYVKPEERKKPWGTAHALACAKSVKENFGVVNADDFYGRETLEKLYKFLSEAKQEEKGHFCLLGYKLGNTLSKNGTVSRGICEVDDNGYLTKITEKTKIMPFEDHAINTEEDGSVTHLPLDCIISMNCFGFTPSYFSKIDGYFMDFLEDHKNDLTKCEFYLPFAVQKMINDGACDVKLVNTNAKWVGVTYKDDSSEFKDYITELRKEGIYPENLI